MTTNQINQIAQSVYYYKFLPLELLGETVNLFPDHEQIVALQLLLSIIDYTLLQALCQANQNHAQIQYFLDQAQKEYASQRLLEFFALENQQSLINNEMIERQLLAIYQQIKDIR